MKAAIPGCGAGGGSGGPYLVPAAATGVDEAEISGAASGWERSCSTGRPRSLGHRGTVPSKDQPETISSKVAAYRLASGVGPPSSGSAWFTNPWWHQLPRRSRHQRVTVYRASRLLRIRRVWAATSRHSR
jgi:hypothetical protein